MNIHVHLSQNQDINSGKHNSVRCGFHSKNRALWPAYKQQALCAEINYDNPYKKFRKWFRTYIAFVRDIPRTELLSLFSKYQACTCFCTMTWMTFSNVVITRVDMRNVFYYYKLNTFTVHTRYSYVRLVHVSGAGS
jgi:hypothetical protein